MKTRVVTGVTLVALIFAVIWLGGWWLRGVALLLMLLSMHEMYAAYRQKGLRPVPVGLALAPLLLLMRALAARRSGDGGGGHRCWRCWRRWAWARSCCAVRSMGRACRRRFCR